MKNQFLTNHKRGLKTYVISGHFNFHLCTQPHFLNSLIWILVRRNDGYLKSGYTVKICILFNSGFFSYLHILVSLHNSILVSNSSIIQEFNCQHF